MREKERSRWVVRSVIVALGAVVLGLAPAAQASAPAPADTKIQPTYIGPANGDPAGRLPVATPDDFGWG
jgi:hypothetical protein